MHSLFTVWWLKRPYDPRIFRLLVENQTKNKTKKVCSQSRKWHSFEQFFWLSPERLWPIWGKGRLVKARTPHMDSESGFLPNCRAHNSVIVFTAQLLRETGANPSAAHCYLSQLSVGWRNNVTPISGFKRGWLKPWWLNRWDRPPSASKLLLIQCVM